MEWFQKLNFLLKTTYKARRYCLKNDQTISAASNPSMSFPFFIEKTPHFQRFSETLHAA